MESSPTIAPLPFWLKSAETLAVALIGRDGRIVDANAAWRSLAGSAGGRLVAPEAAQLWDVPSGQLVYDGHLQLEIASGHRREVTARVFRENGHLAVLAEGPGSVAEIARLEEELRETHRQLGKRNEALLKAMGDIDVLKRCDATTGLPRRSELDERADDEIRRWERYRRPLGLVIMDVDAFARVNEEYGHTVGDEVLQHVSTIVKQSVRDLDFVVRYGGDEFAVLLPETNEMGALIVAERLRMELESQIVLPLLEPLTGSFGVAALQPAETRESLYNRAWRAVKHSIAHGRNCVTMAGVIEECDMIYQGQGSDNV